jgi:hypothetical protein
MKRHFLSITLSLCLLFFWGQCKNEDKISNSSKFKDLDWALGNWKCDLVGASFYQLNLLTNDTTMSIITYKINEQDSSDTQIVKLLWRNGKYRLGVNGEWIADSMANGQLNFLPQRPGWHQIIWKRGTSPDEWIAQMNGASSSREMNMKRAPEIGELLKK